MLYRPSDRSAERQADFEAFAETVRRRTFDELESMLAGLDPSLAEFVYELAFEANEALPRSEHRPQLRPAVLAVAAARAHELDEDDVDAVLGFTVAVQEYFDVLDDVVDGDVGDGRRGDALLAAQLLLSMTLDRLADLGAGAVSYWAHRIGTLTRAPIVELREDRSADTYDRVLDHQSLLLGTVGGVAAVAADREEAAVEHAESVGRLVYRQFALVHDVEQYASGVDGEDDWNAVPVFGTDAVLDRLAELRADVDRATRRYPDPPGERIRSLVALDVPAWREAVLDD